MNQQAVALLSRLRRNGDWTVSSDPPKSGPGPVFIDLVNTAAHVVVEATQQGYGVSVLSHVNGGYEKDFVYQTPEDVLAFLGSLGGTRG